MYSLQSWIDGEDLGRVLPHLSEAKQYALGLKAGEILRKIHSIPLSETDIEYWTALPVKEDWAVRFNRRLDHAISEYHESGFCLDGDTYVLDHIEKNRHLLEGRPQCFDFDDYHAMNMMFSKGSLIIIDFERYNICDPWEAFSDIVWSVEYSHHFATGQIRGYFKGEPPEEFFKLLALYFAEYLLTFWKLHPTTTELGRNVARKLSQNVLKWFYNMQNPIPTWYLRDFYIQWIDGIPFKLKKPFDFSFLSKYGKVFKVFDDQDSGNICFGIANSGKKHFIKFSGAPTQRSNITSNEAIERMKRSVQVYRDLAHPILSNLISIEEVGGGLVMVFNWTDVECMGRMYPLSRKKFMEMPMDTRMQSFDDILDFHAHTAKQGYVAIDFYDGCIMYDFQLKKTIICDIEFYEKAPYINSMGRMWGSSRFMSPEEFQLNETIDEITNVYAMGAMAFAFFGDEGDRRFNHWKGSRKSYHVAKKAVSDERSERQQSIEQFTAEWREAKG